MNNNKNTEYFSIIRAAEYQILATIKSHVTYRVFIELKRKCWRQPDFLNAPELRSFNISSKSYSRALITLRQVGLISQSGRKLVRKHWVPLWSLTITEDTMSAVYGTTDTMSSVLGTTDMVSVVDPKSGHHDLPLRSKNSSNKEEAIKRGVTLRILEDQGDASLVNVIKDETTVVLGPKETANVIQHSPTSTGDNVIKLETTGNKQTLDSSNDDWKFFADVDPNYTRLSDGSLASPEVPGAANGPKQTQATQTSLEASNVTREALAVSAPTPHLRSTPLPQVAPEVFGKFKSNEPPRTKRHVDSLPLQDRVNYMKSREKNGKVYCDHKGPEFLWAHIYTLEQELKSQPRIK